MFFKDTYRVPSARLATWDYSQAGMYFVTLFTQNHACFFGIVQQDRVLLSRAGQVVAEEWQRTSVLRRNVFLDEWQIMPNHLHGIIIITHTETCGNAASLRRLENETFQRNVSTGT
jgi:REP-associated tyrosine transposase